MSCPANPPHASEPGTSVAHVRVANLGTLFAISLVILLSTLSHAADLTTAVHEAIGKRPGAVVVLDVSTGRILAWHDLRMAATKTATPGSAIKPFVLQSLLESGRLNPSTPVACRRKLTISGHALNCSHPESAAFLDASEALAFSCNSYFVKAATLLHRGELESRLQRFGLTTATGLQPSEAVGRIRTAETIAQRQLLAIGAAGIEVTPLELAAAYRELARMRNANPQALAEAVSVGLEKSVAYGMGRLAGADNLKVAGKTGTASESYDPATHAWFAGYAPAERPEIVIVVYLQRGRGSIDAASVAGRVFQSYTQRRTR